MKQSAVSWLIQNIVEDQTIKAKPMSEWLEIFEQAKSMFEEQIKDAWVCGNNNFDEHGIGSDRYAISDEHFYNETYKQQ